MIDTQRLGALLRALIRDEVREARVRTPAASPVRPASVIGPELPRPDPQASQGTTAAGPRESGVTHDDGTAHDMRAAQPPRAEPQTHAQPSAVLRLAERVAVPDDASHPAPAHAENAAPRDASPQRPTLYAVPGGAPPSAALDLSDTGRMLLSALRMPGVPAQPVPGSAMQPTLRAVGTDDRPPAASHAAPARPLVAVPPHSEFATDRLALQLKDAVEFSGVFYESHLAQWADDLRPRALLAHEPQSRWPVAADIAQQAGLPSAPADYATPVLRQQLEVLDTGRFVWTGELWPGQRASLVIEEDESAPSHAGKHSAHAPRWRMRLALEFPQLGAIEATLGVAGESVDLTLRCDDPDVAARLREATPALRAAVAERALELNHVAIADDQA